MAILLFDWGGTSIKYGVWEQDSLAETASVKTPDCWDKMKAQLLAIFHDYRQRYAIQGVAVSAPGNVNPECGEIGGLSAIPYIHRFPIVEELTALFGLPVSIENDANAAGIAEAAMGAGKDYRHVLFIIVGSGVGGAIVEDKILRRGSHRYAGEFGLMTLDNGQTFSELGTAVTMARRYAQRLSLPVESISGADVFRLAEAGDLVAGEEVERFYHWMAVGLLNLQVCYDPDCLVIGGGISANEAIFAGIQARLRALVAEKQLTEFMPTLLLCQYRNEANLIGAAESFRQKFGENRR
ncbi:ROK family protein [Kluyvera georgiana]|uniref:ROK family protein n=1 Tax=Kluyvera georgiana TaxID=73098 RepID=UPI00321FA686